MEELVVLVDAHDNEIGIAKKSEAHRALLIILLLCRGPRGAALLRRAGS